MITRDRNYSVLRTKIVLPRNTAGWITNNIFTSRYVLYMPNKEQLIAQVEAVLNKWRDEKQEDTEKYEV